MIFLLSWIVLFGSLAAMYLVLRPAMIRVSRMLFFISCAMVLLSAAMLGIQSFQDNAQDKAIIVAQTVTAKSSPDAKAVDAFVIHEGLKVKLADAVGGWVKVMLVDGKIGWILSEQCERI
jgi:SH3-like domain-containing protein